MLDTWYDRFAASEDRLQKDAGWQEFKNATITALLGGLILIMAGSSLQNAAQKMNIGEDDLAKAMQDPQLVEQARAIHRKEQAAALDRSMPSYDELKSTLAKHEGEFQVAYPDPLHGWKVPTIGIGHNLTKPTSKPLIDSLGLDYEKVKAKQQSISPQQLNAIFKSDLAVATNDAKSFVKNFNSLPKDAKLVVIDMAFNMGLEKLSGFQKFKTALENEDFKTAAKEMATSKWYGQIGDRGRDLVALMQAIPAS